MGLNVLVIGATGKAGVDVVRALRDKGVDVNAATRAPDKATKLSRLGATPVAFDYDDQETWTGALQGVERVFLSARPADAAPEEVIIPFLDRVRESGIQRVAFMTAMGVDANEELGLRKAERYLEGLGISHTFIRPNWFHQNFNLGMFRDTITKMGGIFVPAEDGKVSFVDTRDIAAVAATVLTEDGHGGKAYTLTGPEALSFGDAATILGEVVGKDLRYTSVSEADARGTMSQVGYQPVQVEFMLGLFAVIRQGWAAAVTFDVKDVTGNEAISLRRFASEHADAWR